MKHNGSIFIYSCTISEEEAMTHYGYEVKPNPKEVILDYKYFIIEYTPISINRARVKMASKVDMHMKFIPQFILKSSALKFGYDYFNNIRKVNNSFEGSPWEAKMRKNPSIYEFFINKIAEYFGEEGSQQKKALSPH